jgi:hypothetical protein
MEGMMSIVIRVGGEQTEVVGRMVDVGEVRGTVGDRSVVIPAGRVELFTVKDLARAVSRTTDTIEAWYGKKYLPPPLYLLPRGKLLWKMFPYWQVVNINRLYVAMGGARRKTKTFDLDTFLRRVREEVFYGHDVVVDESTGEVRKV